jgi:hypothetical protein
MLPMICDLMPKGRCAGHQASTSASLRIRMVEEQVTKCEGVAGGLPASLPTSTTRTTRVTLIVGAPPTRSI